MVRQIVANIYISDIFIFIYIYIYLFIYLDLYYYVYNVLQDYKESMMGQGDKDDFIQTLGLSLLQCAWLY